MWLSASWCSKSARNCDARVCCAMRSLDSWVSHGRFFVRRLCCWCHYHAMMTCWEHGVCVGNCGCKERAHTGPWGEAMQGFRDLGYYFRVPAASIHATLADIQPRALEARSCPRRPGCTSICLLFTPMISALHLCCLSLVMHVSMLHLIIGKNLFAMPPPEASQYLFHQAWMARPQRA